MSYIAPKMQPRVESLPVELKKEILSRNVQINTLHDLITILEEIIAEG